MQTFPTSAITIYHQNLQFLKTVSLSAAKRVKLCFPWIWVHKCPLTNLPVLSQSCLPCLAEQGIMCWLGAPQGPTRQWYCPLVRARAEFCLPFTETEVVVPLLCTLTQLFVQDLNTFGTSSPLPYLIEIGGRRGKMTQNNTVTLDCFIFRKPG